MDAFHFVWRKLAGDVALTAKVGWQKEGGNAHRKAGWMIRQRLDADAPYADAASFGPSETDCESKIPMTKTQGRALA